MELAAPPTTDSLGADTVAADAMDSGGTPVCSLPYGV